MQHLHKKNKTRIPRRGDDYVCLIGDKTRGIVMFSYNFPVQRRFVVQRSIRSARQRQIVTFDGIREILRSLESILNIWRYINRPQKLIKQLEIIIRYSGIIEDVSLPPRIHPAIVTKWHLSPTLEANSTTAHRWWIHGTNVPTAQLLQIISTMAKWTRSVSSGSTAPWNPQGRSPPL